MAGSQFVYISSPLDFSSMVCLRYPSSSSSDPATSDFSLTTMRCRQLIFQFSSQLIACPRTEENAVLVVCPNSLASCPQLAIKCEKLKLKVESRSGFPLSPALFEECLMYTLMARIAPSWNKVGEFLIGGRQFLHQGGHLPAVKLRLHLANSRVEITLQASLVRFPLLQPDDLGIDIAVLEHFILGNEQCLTQENFGRRSVLVLPRLTKAFLLSVTKQLPQGCRFSDWNGIKRYWKNMYGYRLGPDEVSEPTVYYNVCFGSGQPLTYPEWTVRGSPPQTVPRSDPRPIAAEFLKQVTSSTPSICGQRLVFLDPASTPLVATVPSKTASSGQACLKEGFPTPRVPMRSTVQNVKGQSSHWSGQADDSGYETVGHMTVGATSSVDVSPMPDLEEVSTHGPQSSKPAPIKPSFQRVQSTKAPLQPSRPTVPAITPSQGVKPQFSRNLPSATGDNYSPITPNSRPATLAGAAGDTLPDTRSIGRGKAVPSFRALSPKTTFISRLVASHTDPQQPLPGSSLKLKASQLPCRSIKPNLVPPRPTCPSSSLPSLPSTPGTPQSVKKRPAIQEIDIVNLVRTSGVAGLTKVNTATLLAHLRGKGVTEAKAKSKKEELVQRVVKIYQ